MSPPTHFLLEGIDRLGKDTLIQGIQSRYGRHEVRHYTKPPSFDRKAPSDLRAAQRRHQEESFRDMFRFVRDCRHVKSICNRAHLGECVYAPLYRGYSGDYVLELEREFAVQDLSHVRLVLLTENFHISRHFADDGKGLGSPEARRQEQDLFLATFAVSMFKDKKVISVTDAKTGNFRDRQLILEEALGE